MSFSSMELRRREACEKLDNIRIDCGGVTPDDIKFLKGRPTLLKTVQTLQRALAKSAKLVAEQLNTKEAHFVYELIQNAADNKYPFGVDPSLTFTVRENCIIIDSNEFGFSEVDIRAISKINESTKTKKTGFIGEKGIGFKSVFRVARKVHIQSEPYSFSFVYDKGDDGLGMVTPLNEDYLPVPTGIQTRMILYLRDGCTGEHLSSNFIKLPPTLLLFIHKLRNITVKIELPGQPHRHISISSKVIEQLGTHSKVTITKKDGNSVSESKFWLKRREVHDMPAEEAREGISHATVILAFPLDEHDVPVIENQLISAYLPMRMENFKFLIQSDFITGANREDIRECGWNARLKSVIAATFVDAVNEDFMNHPTLRYSCVRYIPVENVAHDYWGALQKLILRQLQKNRCLLSRSAGNGVGLFGRNFPVEPQRLRIVEEEYRDEKGDPLLLDLVKGETAYISEEYDQTLDIPILKKLGVGVLRTSPDILDRLRQDLDRSESKWRTMPFSSDWFKRMSLLLQEALKTPGIKEEIQKLHIIPLASSKWVGSFHASIYFPTSDGINIPKALKLSLVNSGAYGSLTFKGLLGRLGVETCAPDRIVPLIEQRYKRGGSLDTTNCIQDIDFLFWHHNKIPLSGYTMYLAGNDGYSDIKSGIWLYTPDANHPYSMYKLLNGTIPPELTNQINFPLIEYFGALKKLQNRHDKSGVDWLMAYAKIKVTPRLQRRYQRSSFGMHKVPMSAELDYIRDQLPQHLLGVLENDWFHYHKSDEWDNIMKSTKVPILNAREEVELQKTFLPLPSLKKIANQLELDEEFGFLEELDGMTDFESVKWNFLDRFGVGLKEDLHFWLTLLRRAQTKTDVKKEHVFEIYQHLQTYVKLEDVATLREAFSNDDLIYAPNTLSSAIWNWQSMHDCVWNAPKWFEYDIPLNNINEYQDFYSLFFRILQVKDVGIKHCLEYLSSIRASANSDGEEDLETEEDSEEDEDLPSEKDYTNIPLIYSQLSILIQSEHDTSAAKDTIRFNDEKLIYDLDEGTWYSLTDCIWAEDRIKLPGKLSVATKYKDHASFFLNTLEIKKPDLGMHIVSLIQKSSGSPDKDEILQEMRNICALSPDPGVLHTKLRDCKCFPVKNLSGHIEWLSSAHQYAIVDRDDYGRLFTGIVKILDLTLEEVHSVKPLLRGLDLEKNCLSNVVEEETRVETSRVNNVLTEDIRRKAYAIARYAAHLNAPNPDRMFSLLRELEVFTSETIFRTLSVFKNEVKDRSLYHIEEEQGQLKLYVPQDNEQLEMCLFQPLPQGLLEHLGAKVGERDADLVGLIFNTSNLNIIDSRLERGGIINIPGITRPADIANVVATTLSWSPSPERVTTSSLQRPSSGPEPIYRIEDTTSVRSSSWTPPGFDQFTPPESLGQPEQSELFKELIEFVIHQSNHTATLPTLGNCIEASHDSPNDAFNHSFAVQSNSLGAGHRKIGALGELFVFRLLVNLGLSNFDMECWQSRIRHLVSPHHLYTGITQWTGVETTDIVYNDKDSQLTKLLVQSGHLTNLWQGRTPTFYIEVKTTMGDVSNPFFCSQNQFERMERTEMSVFDFNKNEIYLIARVCGLGRSRMGLKLYLDPWSLRRTQQLKFHADVYSVTES